jgi:hypothetical protein
VIARRTLLAIAILLLPCEAAAHRGRVLRRLVIEPWSGGRLEVLASITVPPGPGRAALLALGDANHDGKIADREKKTLEDHLATRALDGVRLMAGSSTLALEAAEVKLSVPADPKAIVELLIHGSASLPKDIENLSVRTGREGDPLELFVVAGKRPVRKVSRGVVQGGSFRASLGPLDEVRWTMDPEALPHGTR